MSDSRISASLQKLKSFLFFIKSQMNTVPLQGRVTLIGLYIVFLTSAIAVPGNCIEDYLAGSFVSAATQGVYLILLLTGLIVFWITRNLRAVCTVYSIGILSLIIGMIFSQGGPYGLGFLYLIAGYSFLYFVLGFWGGIVLPAAIFAGTAVSIYAGDIPDASYLSDPDFAGRYILILGVATVLGILSVVYQHRIIRRLYYGTYIDETTKLPNRTRFEEVMAEKMRRARPGVRGGGEFSLIGLKLYHFSRINSYQGSDFADHIMFDAAQRLAKLASSHGITARYTGTVFVIISPITDFLKLEEFGRILVYEMQQPLSEGENTISLQVGVSITRYPVDGNTTDKLVRNLITGFNRMDKQAGLVCFYDEKQHREETKQYELIEELRQAIPRGELHLVHHPKLRLSDNSCQGSEVLLRWENRHWGPIPPDMFIPLAEDSGIIHSITRWVIAETLRSIQNIENAVPENRGHLVFAVNLSPLDLTDPHFTEFLGQTIGSTVIQAHQLEFEITEGVMMAENPIIQKNLNYIRNSGHRLALDDFGTGYSSLSYLHRLRANNLKIDRSFIFPMNESSTEAPVVDAIISMADSLGMETTAEGIETEFHQHYLRERGCTYGQGWLYTKPLQLDQYIHWLQSLNRNDRPESP